MKTLLLLIFTAITLASHAQTSVYHPFPDSNAIWNFEIYYYCFLPCHCFIFEDYSDRLSGDTVINAIIYHELDIPFVVIDSQISCAFYVPGVYGYIRNDTSAKKVFIIPQGNNIEELLYDFNMQVGDTVKGIIETNLNPKDVVISIDSVLIGNNYRKRWFVNAPSRKYIIEGIGSNRGLISQSNSSFDSLICFQQNNQTLYPDTATSCNIISSINNLTEKENSITLFPNPATTLLTITTTSTQPSQIILFDIASRKLMEEKFTGSATLNIENLAKGVYLYQVRDEKGLLTQGKLVKE